MFRKFSFVKPTILITLTVMGTALLLAGYLPGIPPIVPKAHASPPNNPATLGIFSESQRSNAVIGGASGSLFRLDVNITDAGLISGFDVNITFTGTSITFANSTYGGPISTVGCTTCIFRAPLSTQKLFNTTNANWYRLDVLDSDSNTPFVNGNGILFRVAFLIQATNVASVIHIDATTKIENPSAILYNAVDGYFDNRATTANWSMSLSTPTVTITRPVLSTSPSATGTTTVSVPTAPTGLSSAITLNALSMPINTAPTSFSPTTCPQVATCSSVLTISVHGGPKGGSTTTPSGTYFIPVTGSATATGVTGSVVRVVWLKLVVLPPPAPAFTITSQCQALCINSTAFNQQAGNYTLITLTISLNSGSTTNDSIALSNNCLLHFAAGTCTIKPAAGSFPLTATMNITSRDSYRQATTQPWIFKVNATATTTGTYSEVTVVKNLQITVELLKTHDLQSNSVKLSRNFGYSGIPLATANQLQANVSITNLGTVSETITANATARVALVNNPNLKWVDTGGNTSAPFRAGETVLVDNDGNGLAGYGKYDPQVMFAGTGTTWVPGNPVVYDVDGDGVYIVGKFVTFNDTIISGTIANNTVLKSDVHLKIVDCMSTAAPVVCDQDGFWNCAATTVTGFVTTCTSGEPVFQDANLNGVFDSGETMILGAAPTAKPVLVGTPPATRTALSQGSLSFVDSDYNGVLVTSSTFNDTIIYDARADGVYEVEDPIARGTAPSLPNNGLLGTASATLAPGATQIIIVKFDPSILPRGKYLIAGFAVPIAGEFYVANNVAFSQQFTQRLGGDVNGDCTVDISDLGIVGAVFQKTRGGAGYSTFADMQNTGVIDISDFGIVGALFGHTHC